MKGIILADSTSAQEYPVKKGVSMQTALIYDKPRIFYPLSVLMPAGSSEGNNGRSVIVSLRPLFL